MDNTPIKPVRKAVIAAAGFGTRFLPQTKAMPKEMLPLVDKPIIQYIVEELVEAGIEDIIIVTGYGKRSIEDHFDEPSSDLKVILKAGGPDKAAALEQVEQIGSMANFTYVRQKGPMGTGSALLSAEHQVGDEAFIYSSGDDFIIANPSRFKQLIDIYQKYHCPVLGCIRVKQDEDYERFGFAGGQEISQGLVEVDKIAERPGKANAPSNLATVSGYILTPEIFAYLNQAAQNHPAEQELYYNDALKLMLAAQKRILAYEVKDGKYYDAGNKVDYLKTVVELALQREDIKAEFLAFLERIVNP